MLHLHPGVHLHEVHLAIGEQKLHGTGVLVAHRLGRAHGQVADIGALLGGELRARRNLDELLVAPLDRAVALEQVHGVAEAVGQHLRLDVLGFDDALFQEHLGAAEGLGRLGDHPWIGRFQLCPRIAAANAAAATAGGGLEHHRVTDALGFVQRLGEVLDVAFGARRDRHAGLDHAAPGFGLVAHATNHFGAGADELDSAFGADIRQFRIFGEETIARMQGIAAGFHRQIDQLARVQVAGQRVLADEIGFVGALDVQRMAVGFGEHRHRANAHFGTGADDAYRDFPAVGDQQLLDHAVFPRIVEQATRERVMITRIATSHFTLRP